MTPLKPRRRPATRWRAAVGVVLVLTAQSLTMTLGSAVASEAGVVKKSSTCKRPAHGFVPSQAQIPAIGRTVRVIQVQRTSSGAIGAGPVTEQGKWLMSMDPKTRPGSHHGSVILAGHTWPDGSALGNAMLRNLQPGDQIVLTGDNGQRACYQIAKRQSYPVNQVPSKKAFRSNGPEQVVIVSCSGKRLGPGNWTRRTLWYGDPVKDAPPPPPPAPTPPSSPPSNGGLLGLLGAL